MRATPRSLCVSLSLWRIFFFATWVDASKRDVVVLLPGIAQLLLAQHGERAAEAAARAVRHDAVVDEAAGARDEGIGEFLAILLGTRLDLGRVAQIAAEDDLDRSLWAHHRDLGRGPGIIDVAAQMLRA